MRESQCLSVNFELDVEVVIEYPTSQWRWRAYGVVVVRSQPGDNMGVLFACSQSAYLEYYYSVEIYCALIMRVEDY